MIQHPVRVILMKLKFGMYEVEDNIEIFIAAVETENQNSLMVNVIFVAIVRNVIL